MAMNACVRLSVGWSIYQGFFHMTFIMNFFHADYSLTAAAF
jgi:hypothetical protein